MLAVNYPEPPSTPNYSILNSSIQETFTAIERFEWQASDELVIMRDNHCYKDGAYITFEDYCESELTKHGGYRRVRDLLAAKKVLDTLPNQLKEKITKPSQTRPLLRLVKTPDKLEEAVAIAALEKPFPTMSDFAKAAQEVAPTIKRTTKSAKAQTQLCQKVRICSQSHPNYGQEGVIESEPPNPKQQLLTLEDGSKILVNNNDLDAPSVPFPQRTLPPEYAEALAQKDEQHKREMERLELEIMAKVQAEANARAEAQVQEQLRSLHQLFQEQKERNIQLQQQVDELEALRGLEFENRRQKQRIEELETRLKEQTEKEWNNTFTKQAAKVLNKEVKRSLEKTIDLRSLAIEPPLENAQECLRLMGIALGNLASALNSTQALEAAAIILGSEPNKSAIAYRIEQLQFVPQAVTEIRQVLSEPGCTWWDYLSIAQQYEVIKSDYWAELTTEEKEFIADLEKALIEPAIDELSTEETEFITTVEEDYIEPTINEQTNHSIDEFNESFIDEFTSSDCDDFATEKTQIITTVEQTFTESLTVELTTDQTQSPTIGLGSIVAHADFYSALYVKKGKVIEDLGQQVVVVWQCKKKPNKTLKHAKDELRLLQSK